jgi:hypothetical protein
MAKRYEADAEIFRADSEVGGLSPRDEEQWEKVNSRAAFHRKKAEQHGDGIDKTIGDTPLEHHLLKQGRFFGDIAAYRLDPSDPYGVEEEPSEKKTREKIQKMRIPPLRSLLGR